MKQGFNFPLSLSGDTIVLGGNTVSVFITDMHLCTKSKKSVCNNGKKGKWLFAICSKG